MGQKLKVAILGLGGVGGYLGGKLAARYAGSDAAEIMFIARGDHERAIRSGGLKLITPEGEQISHPSRITSRPEELGVVDLVICCVKSYDLESSLELLRPCITDHTVILPFLNGVDARERISRVFPDARVWEGCIYIISRLIAPGVVRQSGTLRRLYIGSENEAPGKLQEIETLLTSAGINAKVSGNITQTIWEKFLFISPFGTLTSYLDLPIGDILEDKEQKEVLLNLIKELKAVADAKGIPLPEDIVQSTLAKSTSLPYESSSSMRDDFQKGNRTEVESLTGYVAAEGRELHVPTPTYDRMLAGLKSRGQNVG
ncbi:MAG TPA: 2-dehydropantoate 2-reductase [Bacteroidota bacterium]|jgi:2-dehydropantoate 2-reductase